MAPIAAARAELCRLRRDIARIEGRSAAADRLVLDSATGPAPAARAGLKPPALRGRLRLGHAALDKLLGGGLPLAVLHEIRARESRDGAAASGFVLALLTRLAEAAEAASVVWISQADARRETGGLYPPGLAALGLDPARLIQVAARNEKEALWAFEAALACRGLGAAICEMRGVSLDLTATRRCALRARDTGVTGFLLRLASEAEPTAADLRFRLAPAPAAGIGRFAAGIGRMAWRVAVEKNRGGRTANLILEWNAHEKRFTERGGRWARADHQPVSAATPHRPAAAVGEGIRRAS